MSTNWGGKREGSGRKATGTKNVKVRLTSEQHKTLRDLGGSSWLQKELDKLKGHKIIDTKNFTEEQQEQFNQCKDEMKKLLKSGSGDN